MNESADSPPSPSDNTVVTPDPAGDEGIRRRRRRRRRSVANNTPSQRIHYVLLSIIGILLIVSLLGPEVRKRAIGSVRHLVPHFAFDLGRRFDVIALLIAGLVLLYITPGMEAKVLRLFGIKREKRSGSSGRR